MKIDGAKAVVREEVKELIEESEVSRRRLIAQERLELYMRLRPLIELVPTGQMKALYPLYHMEMYEWGRGKITGFYHDLGFKIGAPGDEDDKYKSQLDTFIRYFPGVVEFCKNKFLKDIRSAARVLNVRLETYLAATGWAPKELMQEIARGLLFRYFLDEDLEWYSNSLDYLIPQGNDDEITSQGAITLTLSIIQEIVKQESLSQESIQEIADKAVSWVGRQNWGQYHYLPYLHELISRIQSIGAVCRCRGFSPEVLAKLIYSFSQGYVMAFDYWDRILIDESAEGLGKTLVPVVNVFLPNLQDRLELVKEISKRISPNFLDLEKALVLGLIRCLGLDIALILDLEINEAAKIYLAKKLGGPKDFLDAIIECEKKKEMMKELKYQARVKKLEEERTVAVEKKETRKHKLEEAISALKG